MGEGEDAVFTAAASGCGPLNYLWYKDEVYAGSGTTFTLYDVPCSYHGSQIRCQVNNDCGSVSTETATLSIEFPVGDFNEDCVVNLPDFALLAKNWLAGVIGD